MTKRKLHWLGFLVLLVSCSSREPLQVPSCTLIQVADAEGDFRFMCADADEKTFLLTEKEVVKERMVCFMTDDLKKILDRCKMKVK